MARYSYWYRVLSTEYVYNATRHRPRKSLASRIAHAYLLSPRARRYSFAVFRGPSPAADRPPNVILILIDDMGWTDLAATAATFYETPNSTGWPRSGMRFTQRLFGLHRLLAHAGRRA